MGTCHGAKGEHPIGHDPDGGNAWSPGLSADDDALQYVVDNGLADVVSMSFAAGEVSFHGGLPALQQCARV
jgi:hypothetical protein